MKSVPVSSDAWAKTILMIGCIGQFMRQTWFAISSRSQRTAWRMGRQTAKVPVDREALQNDGIRPKLFPEAGAPGRVHLGINPDSYLELGETAFDQFQKKRVDTVIRRTPISPSLASKAVTRFCQGRIHSRLPKQRRSGDIEGMP